MAQYASKLTFGPETADWQEWLNAERMRNQRVARAQMIMNKHGVAALLEANHLNIRYLTALRGFTYPMCRYVLFFAEHAPVMYEHDGYFRQMPDQCPWIEEWRPAHSWLSGAPGPEASTLKLGLSTFLGRLGDLAMRADPMALLEGSGPDGYGELQDLFLSQWSSKIGGGTEQMQRNMIAERALGLPRDPRP
jgi:alkylation response protein AidB-like acyl-CoA dehydrogenase